ncbi:hypothetical protein VTI28DRAFT_8358 [Corynascus sepedonium]
MPSPTPMLPLPEDVRPHFALQPGPLPQFWCLPPDPEKPACPYRPGFALEIKRHTPPPFNDLRYCPGTWPERSDADLHKVTQTRVFMEELPLENLLASPSPPAPAAKFAILSALAVEDGRGSQLVVCSVAPHASPGQGGLPAPYQAVAKIFGPLYYSFANPEAIHEPFPVAWQPISTIRMKLLRSSTSSREPRLAAAPDCLPPSTLARPSIRTVCLTSSAPASYTEQNRLDIFAAVLDGVLRQRHAGVDQRNLAARNVVLRTGSLSPEARNLKQPLPQPVIVDYNRAVVFELSRFGKHPPQLAALPQKPIELF